MGASLSVCGLFINKSQGYVLSGLYWGKWKLHMRSAGY